LRDPPWGRGKRDELVDVTAGLEFAPERIENGKK